MHQPEARDGNWQLLDCVPAWDGNWTWDCFICFSWQGPGDSPLVVVVNYAANRSQGYVQIPFDDIRGHTICLQDLLSPAVYERNGDELRSRGLYLDLPPWGYHVFRLALLNSTGDARGSR